MSTRFARVSLPARMILVVCVTVMVPINCCCWIVLVRGWPVVVIWVIVPEVFVDVQRRRHGRRPNQGLSKQQCDEPAHVNSVLRSAGALRKMRGVSRLGEWTGYGSVEISTIRTSVGEFRLQPSRLPGTGDRERQDQEVRHARRPVPTP
jgi:hypothetical protein